MILMNFNNDMLSCHNFEIKFKKDGHYSEIFPVKIIENVIVPKKRLLLGSIRK